MQVHITCRLLACFRILIFKLQKNKLPALVVLPNPFSKTLSRQNINFYLSEINKLLDVVSITIKYTKQTGNLGGKLSVLILFNTNSLLISITVFLFVQRQYNMLSMQETTEETLHLQCEIYYCNKPEQVAENNKN